MDQKEVEVFGEVYDRTDSPNAVAAWAAEMIRSGWEVEVSQVTDEDDISYIRGVAH